MRSRTKRMIAVVGVAVFAAAWAPVGAHAGNVTPPPIGNVVNARLYEMTENMRIAEDGTFHRRQATSQLIGTADVGTPLCPQALVDIYAPGATSRTINATGTDNISLGTGLGEFYGTFTTVVQGDNVVDSPEFVIQKGSFKGKMDFSPAVLNSIPLGTVTGRLSVSNGRSYPFAGTFRLPFVLASPLVLPNGQGGVIQVPCGAVPLPGCDAVIFSGAPTPLNPMEHYDLVNTTRPLYLMDDMQNIAPVQAAEFGGGWAAVKFEIRF